MVTTVVLSINKLALMLPPEDRVVSVCLLYNRSADVREIYGDIERMAKVVSANTPFITLQLTRWRGDRGNDSSRPGSLQNTLGREGRGEKYKNPPPFYKPEMGELVRADCYLSNQ
jgi:hypothetical protein